MPILRFCFVTFARPSLVIAIVCGASSAAAQTDTYPNMAAIGQYQMEESAEIQLARSAAPNSISGDATILVLETAGVRDSRSRQERICLHGG